MTTDQTSLQTAETAGTLRELTESTEQFIRIWATELRRHSAQPDRVEDYRQQCNGAINLWSHLAILMYRVPAEVERAGYQRLKTVVEDAAHQARTEWRGPNNH